LKEGKDVMMNVNNEMEVGDEKIKRWICYKSERY